MAKQVKTSLDFNKNEIQNVVVQKLAAAPSTPVSGLIYYDTVLNCFRYYNGTAWISCKATPDVSSVGTGLEIYKGVNAGVMQFRSLEAGSDGSIDCVLKADTNTLVISVNPMHIMHDDLGGYAFTHGHMEVPISQRNKNQNIIFVGELVKITLMDQKPKIRYNRKK